MIFYSYFSNYLCYDMLSGLHDIFWVLCSLLHLGGTPWVMTITGLERPLVSCITGVIFSMENTRNPMGKFKQFFRIESVIVDFNLLIIILDCIGASIESFLKWGKSNTLVADALSIWSEQRECELYLTMASHSLKLLLNNWALHVWILSRPGSTP